MDSGAGGTKWILGRLWVDSSDILDCILGGILGVSWMVSLKVSWAVSCVVSWVVSSVDLGWYPACLSFMLGPWLTTWVISWVESWMIIGVDSGRILGGSWLPSLWILFGFMLNFGSGTDGWIRDGFRMDSEWILGPEMLGGFWVDSWWILVVSGMVAWVVFRVCPGWYP